MNARVHFTSGGAKEIKQLLSAPAWRRSGRAEATAPTAARPGLRISDFEVGLTPAGFDALVRSGVITVGGDPPKSALPAPAVARYDADTAESWLDYRSRHALLQEDW
jgi:hypothetical protein